VRIIGPPSAKLASIILPTGTTALFRDQIAPALWDAAVSYGIDPVGVVAQSYKETVGGTFKGNVRPEFCNPCGLKNRVSLFPGVDDNDNPLAHARFASWEVGAEAHVQHLCAYAGQPLLGQMIVDPRYDFVAGKYALENFNELGGRWAPSLTYGLELVAIARRLQGVTA
jgi:hypothetical protein